MTQEASPPTRMERMVGEIIGLRMLLTELMARLETSEAEAVRTSARAALASWEIGSDTPEGAKRIRDYADAMLAKFPDPVSVIQGPIPSAS